MDSRSLLPSASVCCRLQVSAQAAPEALDDDTTSPQQSKTALGDDNTSPQQSDTELDDDNMSQQQQSETVPGNDNTSQQQSKTAPGDENPSSQHSETVLNIILAYGDESEPLVADDTAVRDGQSVYIDLDLRSLSDGEPKDVDTTHLIPTTTISIALQY
eukprot:scpid69796/ scgid3276/ 